MTTSVALVGGTGFLGRAFVARWPAAERARLTVLVHRSRPAWLAEAGVAERPVDLADPAAVAATIDGRAVVLNLLRPDGDGRMLAATATLVAALGAAGVGRYLHCSSIDVYGRARAAEPDASFDEETPAVPASDYASEHLAAERVAEAAPVPHCVIRLGAVFGRGGRNLVAIAEEVARAPLWRLALRRSLFGRRRMHLVSVETAADALRFLACRPELDAERLLLTDDDAPENDFAVVQDTLARAFSRPSPARLPELPVAVLRMLLMARGRAVVDPMRRFSTARLTGLGFVPDRGFRERLEDYAGWLAAGGLADAPPR